MDRREAVRLDVQKNARQLRNWMGMRGVFTIALGILFLARPGSGVGVLLGIFAAWCLLDGLALIGAATMGDALSDRAMLALEGVVSISAGVLAVVVPGDAAVALLVALGARAFVVGVIEVIAAIRFTGAIPNPWLLAVIGLLSMIFGKVLVRNPQASVLSVTWLVGVYGLVLGAAELGAALIIGRWHGQPSPPPSVTPIAG